MKKNPNEISDNEIRIISATEPEKNVKKHSFRVWFFIIAGVVILLCAVVFFLFQSGENEPVIEPTAQDEQIVSQNESDTNIEGFTIARDTTLNRSGLLVLTPENARPRLIIAAEALNGSNIILATQAADVRGDNGQIAGTFVLDGELISRGEAKAGYCSIINGEITVGVADATPMFEQAVTEKGYFFRQYPLVVGGQIVENKPKGKAIRKAIADLGGKVCVVMSKERLTFHDFSQLLVDLGVRNAVYLVGSSSYGFYINSEGNKILTGTEPTTDYENANYIIWDTES
ncbi:MAG: phosphodiester glycosidase family protein [Muribaculaceae bacterium]|nr:phosphodiester glycosidase family protein [Muribaculaceae bacterium]